MVEIFNDDNVMFNSKNKVDIKDFHIILGRPNKYIEFKTSGNLVVEVNGENFTCYRCLLGKSKRSSIPMKSSKRSTKVLKRFCVDISSCNDMSYGGSKYLFIIEDEF